MAEGRMLKRAITTSKKLSELKTDSARLLYTWLIPFLDVEGRYYGDPAVIKGSIVPRIKDFTTEKVNECLIDIQKVGLILWYEVDGDKYLQFTVFEKHQQLRKDREAVSNLPSPQNNSSQTPVKLQESSSQTPGELPLKLSKDKLSKDKLREYKAQENPNQDSGDINLSHLLRDLILENNPTAKITDSQLNEWTNNVRLMREQDNHTIEEIDSLLQWSQKNNFWQSNILSMGKFREKWNTLWMQRKKGNNYQQPNKRPLSESDERLKEQYRKEEAEEKND